MKKRISAIVALAGALLVQTVFAMDVDTFISLCNEGKFKEARVGLRGYVDSRILAENVIPLKTFQNSDIDEVLNAALPMASVDQEARITKENALLALGEIQRCARELNLDLQLATLTFKRKSDPVSGIVVFVTTKNEIVFGGLVDKIGVKLSRDLKQNTNETNLCATLKSSMDGL